MPLSKPYPLTVDINRTVTDKTLSIILFDGTWSAKTLNCKVRGLEEHGKVLFTFHYNHLSLFQDLALLRVSGVEERHIYLKKKLCFNLSVLVLVNTGMRALLVTISAWI